MKLAFQKKNRIITTLLCVAVLFFFSCDDEDQPGDGGNNTSTKVTISPVTKFEGDETTTFEFKVRLNQSHNEIVNVNFETKDLSAIAGQDYVANSGAISFDGTTEEIIAVEIIPDTLKEGDEEFEVLLTNANVIIERSSVIGTIRNDDDFLPGSNDGYITPDSYPGMVLTWRDEFDGPEIDLDNWTHEIGNSGWGNNELQYYTERDENSYISNGQLVIEAKEESFGGSNYTSARMITSGQQEFTFGRVDIRAKLPEGQGIWPALWMLGANFWTQGWPSCGEIDIMELVGHEPSKVHGTAHWGIQGSPSTFMGGAYNLGQGKFSDEFHVFSIIWEDNSIKWLVDDNQFYSLTSSQVGGNYPFNNNFFFLFNIAVGGNWPGSPNAETVFPQRMFVDYIRIFQ